MLKKPIVTLFLLRLLSSFPFATFYSSLELYLDHVNFPSRLSISIVGSFIALNFAAPVVGGYLGGRFINFKALFALSVLLQLVGTLMYVTHNHIMMFWCLAFFLTGSLGSSFCLNMLITEKFENHIDREKAFIWNYSAMNLGYLIGYSFAGYFALTIGYSFVFITTLVFSVAVLFLLALKKRQFPEKPLRFLPSKLSENPTLKYIVFSSIIILSIVAIRYLLGMADIVNILMIVIWFGVISISTLQVKRHYQDLTGKFYTFICLALCAVLFWSVYLLTPIVTILFIKYHVQLHLGSVQIAPQWLQNIDAVVTTCAPLMALVFAWLRTRKINIDPPLQFSIGLLLSAAGFVILALGILLGMHFGEKTRLHWVVESYLLQSVGELWIGPVGFALVGKLVPNQLLPQMTGAWLMILSVGAAISGSIASFINISSVASFFHFFVSIAIIMTICGIALFIGRNKLRRLSYE